MELGVILGLAAAFCWGTADFFARGATRAASTYLTLLALNGISTAALLLIFSPIGQLDFGGISTGVILAAAGINLAIMSGAALLYRAFAIGTLSVVSPISASFGAVTALLAIITGEHPSLAQSLGIVFALSGVILVSLVPGHPSHAPSHYVHIGPARFAPGLLEAIASMLIFGVTYWALRYIVDALGGLRTAFVGKVSDFIVLALIGAVVLALRGRTGRVSQVRLSRRFVLFVIPNALLDTTANIAYNFGITVALTSVVAVLSSLYTAVTVLLAALFLRERLTVWQWGGILCIFTGIVLVSL